MNDLRKLRVIALSCICILALAGCGGGGGGGGGSVPAASTTVSGVASKGLIMNGVVRIYALNQDGSEGALLKETGTDASGVYSAEIGAYNGPVLVKASGNYTDEATGATMTIPLAAPLRAALGNAAGATSVAVTPLTELAVKRAEDPVSKKLTATAIDNANAQVAAVFKVDIVKTMPIDASAVVPVVATAAQKEYSLALAAISTMMQSTGKDVGTLIADLGAGITTGNSLSPAVATNFQAAAQTFAASVKNTTDIKDVTASQLVGVGGSAVKLKLKLAGAATNGGTAGAIMVTVNLPSGVTVKATNGNVEPTAVALSGVAAGMTNTLLVPNYRPATGTTPGSVTIGMVTTSGFATGEFAFIACDIAPGRTVTAADFSISDQEVTDEKDPVPGLTVVLSLE